MKRLAFLLFLICTDLSATGIPVLDGAALPQEMVSAMESVSQTLTQVEEYQTQLTQLEDQLRNSLAPAAYVWDKAQQTMNGLTNASNMIDGYINQFGSIDGYLNKFRDVGYYRGSPCYTSNGCSDAEFEALYNELSYGSEVQDDANEALLKNIKLQQDSLGTDASNLSALQARAQNARGQMDALQYANQFAAAQVNQLLQLREALLTAQNADNARRQALADLEARRNAFSTSFREGLNRDAVNSAQITTIKAW